MENGIYCKVKIQMQLYRSGLKRRAIVDNLFKVELLEEIEGYGWNGSHSGAD